MTGEARESQHHIENLLALEQEHLDKLMEIHAERSPVNSITWDDLDRIGNALTQQPLQSGHHLNQKDVGSILGLIMRAGYAIIKVGPT